jgi:radical SAM protein with 4Fe4S-binding SPASM domain
MSFDTAVKCVDWIFDNIPTDMERVEIGFIGGEPLIEFPLITKIVNYICESKVCNKPVICFASTNGTLLTVEMKKWFLAHKDIFWLGLSLDGRKDTHDHNRYNSFDKIDIDFFRKAWPEQGVKMTLSEYSLSRLANDVKYLHSLGLGPVQGVNLAEGNFDWSNEEYIKILVKQLSELRDFYVENDDIEPCQMFDKLISACESNSKPKKWCGTGVTTPFFDVDGEMYPCTFITPMTFSTSELVKIKGTDFTNENNFVDDDCYKNCYINPVCPTCPGGSYKKNKTFSSRNRTQCRIQKLISIFVADMECKRIVKNPKCYDSTKLYYTINAINKIRTLYLPEFKNYIMEEP